MGKQKRRKREDQQHKGLSGDIVYEILLRLPVKTLRRFCCVCKQWSFIISHVPFQQDHYNLRSRSKEEPLLLFIKKQFHKQFHKVSFTPILRFSTYNTNGTLINNFSKSVTPLKLRSSVFRPILLCQGLVCLSFRGDTNIHICNPHTRELITLPPTNEDSHCIGFGYASSTKEFKVVRFFWNLQYRCHVFTLNTSEWRESRCPNRSFSLTAPFLHGALHLLPSSNDHAQNFIYAFDIGSENFTNVPLPEYYCSSNPILRKNQHLKEMGGFLWLTLHHATSLDIWLLNDYNNTEWVKAYTIDLSSFTPTGLVWGEPIGIIGGGNLLLDVYVTDLMSMLYCYNPQEKTFTRKKKKGRQTEATLYVESFLNPHGSHM